jgi:hypothetical protein
VPISQVIHDLTHSREFLANDAAGQPTQQAWSREDVVEALFRGVFGREPDETGFYHYLKELENGVPISQVIHDLTHSREFLASDPAGEPAQQALSSEDVLKAVFRGVFDREPDETGFYHYLKELENGVPISQVIHDLTHSREFLANDAAGQEGRQAQGLGQLSNEHVANAQFRGVFDREPDATGFHQHLKELENGMPISQVIHNLTHSGKFLASDAAGQPVQQPSSREEFVKALFRGLFEREPDEAGLNHYLKELENGTSLPEVIRDMTRSREFLAPARRSLVQEAFVSLLGRRPSEADLTYYVDRDIATRDFLLELASSEEFLEKHANRSAMDEAYGVIEGALIERLCAIGISLQLTKVSSGADAVTCDADILRQALRAL